MKTLETSVLNLACKLHTELSTDTTGAWCGYEGAKESFDCLFAELNAIACHEVSPSAANFIEQVEETFYAFQNEIAEGNREIDWYLTSD